MEFRGRILKVSPVQSGTSSAGKEWKRQEFQFEYFENPTDRWTDKVALSLMNDRIIPDLQEGEEVVCGFSHNIRDWNGKAFNDLRCYKLERVAKATAQPTPTDNGQTHPQASPQPPQSTQAQQVGGNATPLQSVQEGDDDGVLPF